MMTDIRHAFRLLWKSKRITSTTLVTLALCIGMTTAIFSSVYALMLKPLPYQEPERIVELYSSASKAGLDRMPANVPFYLDYSQHANSYESIANKSLVLPQFVILMLAMFHKPDAAAPHPTKQEYP